VNAAVNGTILSLLQFSDGIYHHPGFLRGSPVIEIDQGLVVDLLLQNGEITPDLFYIEAHDRLD